ncbi:unnamed protein product [Prorocentrum cordatum]|nr:unnamed protein product [Polarella glacialis]
MAAGMAGELNEVERESFHMHFLHGASVLSKGKEGEELVAAWESVVREALEMEKPMATKALEEAVNSAEDAHFFVSVPGWMENMTRSDHLRQLGRVPPPNESNGSLPPPAPAMDEEEVARRLSQMPESFSASENWPHCASVFDKVHNQGLCGSCWAFAGVHVVESRLCIATGGAVAAQFSRGFVTSCARNNGWDFDGCRGGLGSWAWEPFASTGVPTGGQSGCVPYWATGAGVHHFEAGAAEASCPSRCSNAEYDRAMPEDSIRLPELDAPAVITVYPGPGWGWVLEVQQALMEQGMCLAGVAGGDAVFMAYRSGVYDVPCRWADCNHETVISGWGAEGPLYEGRPFHFVLHNSWGGEWGEGGKMKIAPLGLCDVVMPGVAIGSDVDWGPPLEPPPPPPDTCTADGCVPFDNDACLQATPKWGSHHDCASSTRWCDSWAKDMHRCCSLSCNVSYLTEESCDAVDAIVKGYNGTCEYPHEGSDCTIASRAFDNDACLKASFGWGPAYHCAGSTHWCDSWAKDMHRCCSLSCNVGYLAEEACEASNAMGSCQYPHEGSDRGPQGGCVFPFFFSGKRFEACTTELALPGQKRDEALSSEPLCATEVGDDLEAKAMGVCDRSCFASEWFRVTAGPCAASEGGRCLTREHYGDLEGCTVAVTSAAALHSHWFNTEKGFDILTIDGQTFSGPSDPSGWGAIIAGGHPEVISGVHVDTGSTIVWTSDEIEGAHGFKVCNFAP